jgi:predicted CXXCH cytochrome family protein
VRIVSAVRRSNQECGLGIDEGWRIGHNNFAAGKECIMKKTYLGVSAVLFFCSLFFFPSSYQMFAATSPSPSCVTATCHAKIGKEKFVHGPVAVNDCLACHKETGKHKFAPIKNVAALCYACHDKMDAKKTVHKPVKDGNCTKCHNPHQSPNKFMLSGNGAQLCFQCHTKNLVSGKFLHGPVAAGECTSCHGAHQADFPLLLQARVNDVCFSCHTDKKDDLAKKKVVHKPVKENCIGCHTAHSSNFNTQLKNESTTALCYDCHKEMKATVAKARVPHKALNMKKGCLECHDTHAANFPRLLGDEPMNDCLRCHNKEYKSGAATIANIQKVVVEGKLKHGPIREKDCSSCHNTHGSENFRILRSYFPPVFYAPFDVKNYELCFTCHQKTLVLDSKTTTLTGFRNGEQNLHFVHVNKVDKGRTCRACHEAHANNNPGHIRDSVPFGGWKIPINYKKMEDGGTCLPGCHAEYPYNRKKPVKNK